MRISDWSSDVCSSDLSRQAQTTPFALAESGRPYRGAWAVDGPIILKLTTPQGVGWIEREARQTDAPSMRIARRGAWTAAIHALRCRLNNRVVHRTHAHSP